jgi:hypothetical protein
MVSVIKSHLMKNAGWFLLFFLIINAGILDAQQWRPVTSTEKFNYRVDTAGYISNTILVDSLKMENGDSVFCFNRVVTACPSCPYSDWKLYNQPQFLKKKMTRKPGGMYVFSDPGRFYIKTLAGLNESWVFDSAANITAQVTAKTWETVFNIPDSVKTISLSNGQVIKLSKDHGITEFPLMGKNHTYSLEGIAGRDLGTLIPGFFDFFNFNVGDVFQYHGKSINYGIGYGTGWLEKVTVISRDSSPEGYHYGVISTGMSWQESLIGPVGDSTHFYYDTTNVYIDSAGHPCNFYPLQLVRDPQDPVLSGPNASWMKIFSDTGQVISRQEGLVFGTPEEAPLYNYGGPDTLEPAGYMNFIKKYSTGLGQVIDRVEIFEISWYNDMIGYVKSGDTTGIVYPDEFILQKINERKMSAGIKVFPNPARERIYIQFPEPTTGSVWIGMFSTDGRNVFSSECDLRGDKIEVTLPSLSPGIYFVRVTSGENTASSRIFITR